MTSDWNKYRIGDVCSITSSKRIFANEYVDSGIPFYRGKEIIEKFNGKQISTELYITLDKFLDIKNKYGVPQKGDILLTSVGTLGIPYRVKDEQFYFKDGNLTWFQNFKNVDSKFLYLWFCSKYAKNQILAKCIGSTQKALTIETLKQFEIILPPLETQQKIAKVLSVIDDKIELNNSINKNLEQQMQSIFLELFPFIFNNANDTLEKIISFSNGKKRPENMGTIPVYGGNGILAYSDSSNSENCVIIGRVGAYCGNTFLCTGPCWVSDNAIQAKSKIGDSQLFIFYILKNAHLQSRHIGTGQPLMTQGILNSIPFNMPDIRIIKQFTDNCEPMQKLIIDNTIENERLTQLRDTLLPKLMNGEIDVDKVEA